MSKHLIAILFIISMAFNLAVLGMFMYAHIFHKPLFNPAKFDRKTNNKNWSHHSDRMSPDSLFKNKDEIRKLREDFKQARKDFVKTMTKATFNEKESIVAMEASLKAQETLERKLGASLIEVRKTMTAEQAKKFFEHRMFRADRRSGNWRPRLRYDTESDENNQNPSGEKR